jgi:hypothetical protein
MDPMPSPAKPPRRLFRLGRADHPLAPLDRLPDQIFGGRAVVLCSTRRGAFIEALAPGQLGEAPARLPADAAVVAVRYVDPRPLVDLRAPIDPSSLPAGFAEVVGQDAGTALPAARLPEAFALAAEAGFAGVAYRSALAPSQVCWAIRPDASLTLLDAPRPVSPHDPDLVAVGRRWDQA